MMRTRFLGLTLSHILLATWLTAQPAKTKLTFDEFFNSVAINSVQLSPDANSLVITTERADWERQIYRKDIWLYRAAGGSLVQLTQSGRASAPAWSPDGEWIAFRSECKSGEGKNADEKEDDSCQLFLISPSGGEAFPITSGDDEIHAFAWAADSKSIYFATQQPWTKQQNDDHTKEWKDVIRYRADERGDVIFRIPLDTALAHHAARGTKERPESEKDSGVTPGAAVVARTPLRVEEMTISRDGSRLAFMSSSISERQEKAGEFELYMLSLANPAPDVPPIQLTHNAAIELNLQWAPDSRHLFFQVNLGSLEGKYEDVQTRLYSIDTTSNEIQRWFGNFSGEVVRYAVTPDGSVLCACRLGTEIQLHAQANPKAAPVKREGWPGTYEIPAFSPRSPRVAFVYSAIDRPSEVYLAEGADKLTQARAVTSFNKLFTERDLPQAKP